MKCTTFERNYSCCRGRNSENICSSSGGAQEKGKTAWNSSLPPKLVENLVWVPVISFCKIFIPSYVFDALLCQNWPFSPPNCVTLWIKLLSFQLKKRMVYVNLKHKNFFITESFLWLPQARNTGNSWSLSVNGLLNKRRQVIIKEHKV
jgi:hypothetical protein